MSPAASADPAAAELVEGSGAAGDAPAEAPPVALYVHVPFCVSHCPYCDFVVVSGREARGPVNRIGAFLDALEVELELRAAALDARWGRPGAPSAGAEAASLPGTHRPVLDSLYLGGGTPSLLPPTAIARLIAVVRHRFGLAPDAEVTLEANPGPDERGDAGALHEAGVTRLSIGAQSLEAAELRALGRRHTPADVGATVDAARAAGIHSVSLDLLYDIPGSSLQTWARTLDAALRLEPDHLSLYALTLDDPDAEGITGSGGDHLPLRPGPRRWRERARPGQDDDRAAAMYEVADLRLAAAGFAWYEISNWARPGHRSRHNLAYWQRLTYEAVGPGAHAFDGRTRRWNAARLDRYLEALRPTTERSPKLPPGGEERLDGATAVAESAILALRTSDGLPASTPADAWVEERCAEPLRQGLLERVPDGRLVLTVRGRLLSNEVFGRLL
ncbi:MAG TPA: coproporphyrinogen-III oxidase family protein [Candidatus Limnocylindria bacterium]|nr:coproporphyrinogen-III oxidase family protein [Candidatus Limnocylindria bacterium]